MQTHRSRSIWRRLPVDRIEGIEAESGAGTLTKSLGLWQLTAIGRRHSLLDPDSPHHRGATRS